MWSRPEARQAAPRRAATERAVQGPFISNSVTRWRISCRASPFGGAPRARRKGKWGGGMRLLISLLWLACMGAAALADACPHHPDAIGTGRSITVDPGVLPRIGTMQYKDTLPLADHEVVITYDDGPLPPFTTHVLATLRENCAKATFFLVGAMARAYPWVVRRIYNDGHTIGTHSENHPFALNRRSMAFVEREVEAGIASVTAAVGDPRAVAPFFRVPGLARSDPIETFLAARSLAVWSADEVADDCSTASRPTRSCVGPSTASRNTTTAASFCCTTFIPPRRLRCRSCWQRCGSAATASSRWWRRAKGRPPCRISPLRSQPTRASRAS